MTPRELLRQVQADREALAALWRGLPEDLMVCRPGPQKDWSVKDLIAHVTWWESFVMEGARNLVRGEESQPSEDQDLLNRRSYDDNMHRPPRDILAAFDVNWFRLEALISSLTDEQLNEPGYYRTYDGIALLPILRAGTIAHYPAHLADLLAYVQKAESPQT
jgi:hypothetical protein